MSHDHSRRDSCEIRISCREVHSKTDKVARSVTDVVVGSGALLGRSRVAAAQREFLSASRKNSHISENDIQDGESNSPYGCNKPLGPRRPRGLFDDEIGRRSTAQAN